ncbi:protein dachsous [Phlebotomus papatasi]|nr:protein dachsous [Phlebotomus papatasi]
MPKKKSPPKKSGGDVEDKKAQEDVYILIKKQTNKKVDANKTKGDFVVVAQIDDGMPGNGPFPQVISFLWVLFGWHKVGEDEKPAMGFLCFLRANRIIIDQLPCAPQNVPFLIDCLTKCTLSSSFLQVSATDPDCGVNAMVNYTLGSGFRKLREFEVKSATGEVCISGDLDYELRTSYEFPIIATDRGGLSTTAMVKIQLTDVNDNRPTFYPREYNVSLREPLPSSSSASPVVAVVATDPDSGRFGVVTYRIVGGNEAGIFRIDRISGEIFLARPTMLSSRVQPYHRLNISASDGGGLRTSQDAEVFISVIDSAQRPPIFEKPRYNYYVKEDVKRGTVVGAVLATSSDSGSRGAVRYSIYSGDPDGYFSIDPMSGNIRIASPLDHETKVQVLLNIQATSGDPPAYGHTQVNIDIEDVNDNPPEFESSTVRISVPENVELGTPLYVANAHDRDSGKSGVVTYRLSNIGGGGDSTQDSSSQSTANLFSIDSRTGHLTLSRHLDYETTQRHSLIVTATDSGEPPLAANLTVLVEVQDVNDNPPVFERNEYAVKVSESTPINSQILQVTAVDLDTGNNARLTYRIVGGGGGDQIAHLANKTTAPRYAEDVSEVFGIFPNSGWLYLHRMLDRETRDRYEITVVATDNGTPAATATTRVIVNVLDANDNDPRFSRDNYEFSVEENMRRGAIVGVLAATDADLDANAAIRYTLIPSNTSFQVNPMTGEIITREPLDRETRSSYDLVAEARDQGTPYRSSRVSVRVLVTDVNDNAPDIVDPQEDVVSVREEQPPGTEVVRIRAVDRDNGYNASVTYSILKGRDSDGFGLFSIDPMTGLIKTRMSLDHEERSIYRLAVAATDGGKPPKQTVRLLRVEVLDLNDNRPTFTSSSLVFKVREDVAVGHVVGSVSGSDHSDSDNLISGNSLHITYTLTSITSDVVEGAFDMDRNTGSLIVTRKLDREQQSEYRLEIRALDTSASNNPQSSAVTVRVDIVDVNDNSPVWPMDPITIEIGENANVGSVVYNFSAHDSDAGVNGEIQYHLVKHSPGEDGTFELDPLTGSLTLLTPLDYEFRRDFLLVIQATDQATITSDRRNTSVTARIVVTDINDNAPNFVLPSTDGEVVYLSDAATVGQIVTHIVAVDADSGDNGRVIYSIVTGNEDGRFSIDAESGYIVLAKPIIGHQASARQLHHATGGRSAGKYNIIVSATDRGSPVPKETRRTMQIVIQGSTNNPPRFLEPVYHVNVSENIPSGSFVIRVGAKSFQPDNGGNLTFEIPTGVADDHFVVDPIRGIVTTRGAFDRESKDMYTVPIYVKESSFSSAKMKTSISPKVATTWQFDVATIVVRVTDVNDHAPEFRPGSCYPLRVPENSDLAVIHTVVATDMDEGLNGDIIYSITGGNIGNKFSIDMHTGELTARPLDREAQSRYTIQVTAQDRGSPITYHGTCNISIAVEDQNDNDPRFELSKYIATIAEDVPIGTSVLTVRATDADLGINSRIVYSLANETQWLFSIDNRSGLITTAGLFDREKENVYNFMVVATDGGKYDARSQKVPVQIIIDDVNDNKPVFEKYPFKGHVAALVQPGQTLLQVSATDEDQGTNGEIVYSLINDSTNGKFRINPNTGSLSATQSLASENGKLLHLEVIARDKGNPPQTAIGLIELQVGDIPPGTPHLRFQNDTYVVRLPENGVSGQSVVQLNAVRSDGRRQRIIYSIGSGNEDGAFTIDAATDEIKIHNADRLDFERYPKGLKLIAVARTEGNPVLYGYCEVRVLLVDENDNAPRFTQHQYSAAVWEGNNKGTFVMQVSAYDADQGSNSRILYHIVDGNHDNAFIIEPAFSGIVKTNIVLDREIRDMYRLKVIATDEGVPQMTGTTTIQVHIVDVNDNQPTFPPHSIISVSEGIELGTVLTSITANDVDTNPALTYTFVDEASDPDATSIFAIDRFSGKVILRQRLDYETRQEYQLKISASDTSHLAQTTLTIRVTDQNDNAPIFQQPAYHTILPDEVNNAELEILTVNATDADSEVNAKIRYSIVKPISGFRIGESSGILYANTSRIPKPLREDIQLTVAATDSGNVPLMTTTTVRIHVNSNSHAKPQFMQNQYRATIKEDIPRGSVVIRLSPPDLLETEAQSLMNLEIVSGNDNGTFEITNPGATIITVKSLDREVTDLYHLRLMMSERGMPTRKDDNSTAINVFITVDDANDNAPLFQAATYEATISEAATLRHSIAKIQALDADLESSPNSEVVYDITSGNDSGMFTIDLVSGVLFVNNELDYDSGDSEFNLVIRACDSATKPMCSLQPFHIQLTDENDNEPKFPVSEYLEFVGENEPVGVSVFTARATDMDKGVFGQMNYTIVSSAASGYSDVDESWKLFKVDPETGVVNTNAVFDYEQKNRYTFTIKARDIGGKTASVRVRVMIESRDEFSPQFTERTYRFVLATPSSGHLPVGYVVGHVTATDRDKGPDGRVVYQLSTQHPYFKMNRTTGAVMVKKKLDNAAATLEAGRDISLVVTASSGRQGSLTNMTVVEIALDPLGDPGTNIASATGSGSGSGSSGLADWALGLLISLILVILSFAAVFVFLHMRNRRHKQVTKPSLSAETVGNSNSYVDPSAFDTIPIRGNASGVSGTGQFAPPKYDEIPPYGPHTGSSNSGAPTTSELSGSEQSGSSGRGSAEDGDDGEDEEIRMINEGPLQRDTGLHRGNDDGRLSGISVQNTQEYLARLGIVDNPGTTGAGSTSSRHCSESIGPGSAKDAILHHTLPIDSLHNMFDEEPGGESDITNLIYAKLNDVAGGSDRASSADEAATTAGSIGAAVDHVMVMGGFGDGPVVGGGNTGPSMNGSLSSIVHSEEELTGSYNWDYLLDWGPQYQPLAHVFSEIARLKDDTLSVHSGNSGASSAKSKGSLQHAVKHIPPPLLTNVAPRTINAMPVLPNRGPGHHSALTAHQYLLPRSPISHDAPGGGFSTSSAMSPSFSPSLSPLATRSPSISPHVNSGLSTSHHMVSLPRHQPQPIQRKTLDPEMRVRI